MYGVKITGDAIITRKGTGKDLKDMEICGTKEAAQSRGETLLYLKYRNEFQKMSLEELDTPRAYYLEKCLWEHFPRKEKYIPGCMISRRKEYLKRKMRE